MAFQLPYNSSYLSLYFSVRSRALASLVSALAQVFTTLVFGAFLDWARLSSNRRAKYGYTFMMSLIGGCWAWGTVVQVGYSQHKPSLDWDDAGFGRGWALYILWSINFSLAYNYGFWLIGLMARDPKEVVRYMSVARAVEAAGQCIASGISSTSAPASKSLDGPINTRELISFTADGAVGPQLCFVGTRCSSRIPSCQAGWNPPLWPREECGVKIDPAFSSRMMLNMTSLLSAETECSISWSGHVESSSE